MNYARLSEWSAERVEELVAMGVPRVAATEAMSYVELRSINAESEARTDAQFLIEFDAVGSEEMGRRRKKSGQAMRKKRTQILRKSNPELRAQLRG